MGRTGTTSTKQRVRAVAQVCHHAAATPKDEEPEGPGSCGENRSRLGAAAAQVRAEVPAGALWRGLVHAVQEDEADLLRPVAKARVQRHFVRRSGRGSAADRCRGGWSEEPADVSSVGERRGPGDGDRRDTCQGGGAASKVCIGRMEVRSVEARASWCSAVRGGGGPSGAAG